ncbi:monocarboxylate transporter 12-like [Glandiceps talaboti]
MTATSLPPSGHQSKKTNESSEMSSKPPDGGWGWFIVLGTFLSTVITSGTVSSFGIFYVAFLNAFNKSKSETAWIGSISAFVFTMSSPLSIALARKVGHRKVVMTGGIVAATGHLLSSFATSIYHLYITYGIITGLGLGLGHIASMEIVGKYFKRRLPIAMGIALTGGGLGQFVLSTTSQAVIDFYGWRGTLLIFSAFTLHMCVAGSLFRPLPVKPNSRQIQNELNSNVLSTVAKGTYALIEGNNVRNKMINTETKEDSQQQYLDSENNTGVDDTEEHPRTSEYQLRCCNCAKSIVTSLYDVTLFTEPVRRGVDYGMTPTQASFLTAVMGIGQIVGRPVIGFITNLPKMKPTFIWSTCFAMCAVLCITSIYLRSFIGSLRDHFGTYYQAFWIAGCSIGVSAGLVLSLLPVHKFVNKRRNKMGQTLHVNNGSQPTNDDSGQDVQQESNV